MAKRGYSEGSIFRAADGRYVARISLGFGPDGRRRRREFRARTRAEAREWLDSARNAQKASQPIPPGRLKVGQYLDDWIEAVSEKLRPRTVESYRQTVHKHLKPGLGDKKLKELTADHIDHYLSQKRREGLSASSRKYHHAILSSALSRAVKRGLVGQNVARLVEAPTVKRAEVQPLSIEGARKLLEAAQGDRLEALFNVALALGLREGECFGLRWSAVVLDPPEGAPPMLSVIKSVQRISGQLQLVDLKTEKSRRLLVLPPFAVEALRAHRDRQAAERKKADELGKWEDYGLVFCTEWGTPLAKENVRRRHWLPLLKRAGLPPMRFHDLRHSCASLLHAQGADLRLIMEVLGHSQVSTTANVYTHVLAQAKEGAARWMEAALVPGGDAAQPDLPRAFLDAFEAEA